MNKRRQITDFTEREYKQFAQNKNFQSIASIFGYKPTANKVLYTVYDDNVTSFSKVEDISSATSLKTKYLGGSSNIDGVTINISKTYCGSNNISVLDTKGDFGARLDSTPGAGRYIFIRKNKNFDTLFNKDDLDILPQYSFEGTIIEYRFFTFNLPLLLINGAEGMGSGHAQSIIGRNPEEIKTVLENHLRDGTKIITPTPWFNGFTGDVKQGENTSQWIVTGKIQRVNDRNTIISEIPIDTTIKAYKKKLDVLVDKKAIMSYDDLCDPKKDTISFKIRHDKSLSLKSDEELIELFKLNSKISENYTSIDENNKVKCFKSADELFNHYIDVKLSFLTLRKESILSKLMKEIEELDSKVFFIDSVIKEKIQINNVKKQDIFNQLESVNEIIKIEDSYDYLLRMPLYTLTVEKIEDLKESISNKKAKYKEAQDINEKEMWLEDLSRIKF